MTPAALAARLPVGRPGQAMALAATLALLVLIWFAAASPLLAWYDANTRDLALRQMLAGRMADAAASLPALRNRVQSNTAGAPEAAALLDGATDAIAGATLQQLLEAMATRDGATLSSVETLPTTQIGGFRRIGLRLSINAPWPVLARLLLDVEQATPSMLTDDVQIHGVRLVSQPGDPPLDAGFAVYAFRAGSAPPRASGVP